PGTATRAALISPPAEDSTTPSVCLRSVSSLAMRVASGLIVVQQPDGFRDRGMGARRQFLHEVRAVFLVLAEDFLLRGRGADGARVAQRDDELFLAGGAGELEQLVRAERHQRIGAGL